MEKAPSTSTREREPQRSTAPRSGQPEIARQGRAELDAPLLTADRQLTVRGLRPAQAAAILHLQRAVGNQAVLRAMGPAVAPSRRGTTPSHAPPAHGTKSLKPVLAPLVQREPDEGGRIVQALLEAARRESVPVQRNGERPSSAGLIERERLREVVEARVAKLPEIPPESVPSPEDVEQAKKQGESARSSITELVGPKPEVQAAALAILAEEEGGGGPPAAAAAPAAASPVAPEPEQGPPPSEAGLAPEEPAGLPPSEADLIPEGPSPLAGTLRWQKGKKALTTGKGLIGVLGTATYQSAKFLAGAGQATLISIGQVTSSIGYIFSALQAAMDLRAIISSVRRAFKLEHIRDEAIKAGHPREVVEAVIYAIGQKYEKAIKRLVSLFAALVSVTVGITLMATAGAAGILAAIALGPPGWGVLGVVGIIGTAIGVSLLVWNVGRWLWKKYKGSLHTKRKGMAARLYTHGVLGDDQVAQGALKALGLNPADLSLAALMARAKGPDKKAIERERKLEKDIEFQHQEIDACRQLRDGARVGAGAAKSPKEKAYFEKEQADLEKRLVGFFKHLHELEGQTQAGKELNIENRILKLEWQIEKARESKNAFRDAARDAPTKKDKAQREKLAAKEEAKEKELLEELGVAKGELAYEKIPQNERAIVDQIFRKLAA